MNNRVVRARFNRLRALYDVPCARDIGMIVVATNDNDKTGLPPAKAIQILYVTAVHSRFKVRSILPHLRDIFVDAGKKPESITLSQDYSLLG